MYNDNFKWRWSWNLYESLPACLSVWLSVYLKRKFFPICWLVDSFSSHVRTCLSFVLIHTYIHAYHIYLLLWICLYKCWQHEASKHTVSQPVSQQVGNQQLLFLPLRHIQISPLNKKNINTTTCCIQLLFNISSLSGSR